MIPPFIFLLQIHDPHYSIWAHLLFKWVLLKLVGLSVVLSNHGLGLYRGADVQCLRVSCSLLSSFYISSSQIQRGFSCFFPSFTSKFQWQLYQSFSPEWLSHFYEVHGCF